MVTHKNKRCYLNYYGGEQRMADDTFRVDAVFHDNDIHGYDVVKKPDERMEERHEGNKRRWRRPKDYFTTLAKRAGVTNQELAKKKLPYRFCVYEQGGEVFIDVVTLDAAGKVSTTVRRNITDEDFDRWIDDISILEGLFLDTSG